MQNEYKIIYKDKHGVERETIQNEQHMFEAVKRQILDNEGTIVDIKVSGVFAEGVQILTE